MKKGVAILLIIVFVAGVMAACAQPTAETPAPAQEGTAVAEPSTEATATEEAAADAPKEELTFGYLAYNIADVWNQYGYEAFVWAAEQDGVKVEMLDAKNDSEKQVSQAQDFINKGVDGISIFPVSPEVGATVVRMANEAGIPIALENIFLDDDTIAGIDLLGQVACEYNEIGYAAIKYAAETYPGCKLLYVHGGPGLGVYESYKIGVDKALEKFSDKVELVGLINGEWATEPSYNVTVDFINSGESEFDVVFANNDLQATGVYNALKEYGMEAIPIISTGGSEQGYQMVEDGQEAANITAPVNIQGQIVYDFLKKGVAGETITNKRISLPLIPIGMDNFDQWIKWDDNAAAAQYIAANVTI